MWNQPEYYKREKLYEEVWAEPVSKVAERYKISDVALAKVCRKMHIPVPGRGYWSKLQSGQSMQKTPLPTFANCPQIRRQFRKNEEEQEKVPERLLPEAFILEEQLITQESLPEMYIKFDPSIKLSHQYVRNTAKNLKDSSKNISKTYGYGRCNSNNDEAFEVSIGPDNIQRTLAILQTICNALAKRGYTIGTKPKEPNKVRQYQYDYPQKETNPIYAIVLDTYISFKITETSRKKEVEKKKNSSYSYEKFEYVPSGKLCFEILNVPYGHHTRNKWQEGKVSKVEDQLNDIIINLIKVATIKKEKEAQSKRQHELWRIEEEKRKKREILEKIEQTRIEHLIKETARMIQFNQVKEYIEVIVAEGKRRLGDKYPDSDFSAWVSWAEQFLEKNNATTWDLPKFEVPDYFGFYRKPL